MVNWDRLEEEDAHKLEELYSENGIASQWAGELYRERSEYTSQLRNFLSTMETVKATLESETVKNPAFEIRRRLIPAFANARAKKDKSSMPSAFYEKIVREVEGIKTKKGFNRFLDFFKAIVQFYAFKKAVKIGEGQRQGSVSGSYGRWVR